jgi:hypothetical protein
MVLLLVGCAAERSEPPRSVLISDYRANAILRFDDGMFAGTFAESNRPAGLRLGDDGALYAAGFGRGDVVRYDMASGAMMGVFYWDTTELEEPVQLRFHGDELVVLGNDTNNLVVLARDGSLVRTIGYSQIRNAHDFVIDEHGRALIATDSHVQIWDLASGTQIGELGRKDLQLATSITTRDDEIYVADQGRDAVLELTSGRVIVTGLHDPVGIEAVGDDLYILDAEGLARFDGEALSRVIPRDHLQSPRAFTFF